MKPPETFCIPCRYCARNIDCPTHVTQAHPRRAEATVHIEFMPLIEHVFEVHGIELDKTKHTARYVTALNRE